MKLLITSILTAALIAGLACALGLARVQEAPAGQAAPALVEGSATSATGQTTTAPTTLPAAAAAAADQNLTPEQERTAMVEAIREEMDLPVQADTGVDAPNFWMPQSASAEAPSTDGVYWYITWVTIIFTVLILGLMGYFAFFKYRHREGDPDPEGVATHSTTLELTWTIIPTCIVLVMFTLGFRDFLGQTVGPPNAYEITATGQMWQWSFTYPNGAITTDLHIPKDQPVRFVLQSTDVIHSLFIPAFRLKKDVVPGRFNQFYATPTEAGIFEVYCTEYCGTNHSRMIAKCFVYPEERYDEMLARISNIYFKFPSGEPRSPVEVGEALWSTRGCRGCHSVDGSIVQAPSWRNLFGATRTFNDGSTGVADENYLRESIVEPQVKIVAPYSASMPSFAGQLTEQDLNSIIAYIKSVSESAKSVQDGEVVRPGESQSLGGRELDRGEGGGERPKQ